MPDPETNDPSMTPREPRPQDSPLSTADLAGRSGVTPAEPRSFKAEPREDIQDERPSPLFHQREIQDLRADWDAIQGGFVDEPRKAVEDADELVATTMKRLADMFAEERQNLEHQWDRGDEVSTEELRLALRRYRSFFDRLLAV